MFATILRLERERERGEGVGHHSWFMGRVGKWMKTMKRDVSWRGIHFRKHLLGLT